MKLAGLARQQLDNINFESLQVPSRSLSHIETISRQKKAWGPKHAVALYSLGHNYFGDAVAHVFRRFFRHF